MKEVIQYIEELIQRPIHDEQLIYRAFYHRSYANEFNRGLPSNERLEFLGDAVLELLVSEFLFKACPQQAEGTLTRKRAQIVREESLAILARELHFDRYLKLGRGEEATGGRERDSLLADCFEAVLGAIYLDQSLEIARSFIHGLLMKYESVLSRAETRDYKTQLQEYLQKGGSIKIQYKLTKQTGPSHNATFYSGIYVEDQLIATGEGKTKKAAEMQAAQKALASYQEKD